MNNSHYRRGSSDPEVVDHAQPVYNTRRWQRSRKKFVLCFDGTGNKFSGTDADSNILKIYRCLARNSEDQFHYYQPGIGTYVTTNSLSHTSRWSRFKSWYNKAKDSAIGTSFDQHVMAGYKFLMRYYSPGDDIYFFGFSRGAYTARFLAEMLDHVGLLSAGNEEMAYFAWKTFQKWQCRTNETQEDKVQKKALLEFMCAFRETFSRPVHRLKFLGLFDTVNSVPKFENAWMQRSKFPYTARSTAKVIRHACSIDERRAKFRQDLISEARLDKREHYNRHFRKTCEKFSDPKGSPQTPNINTRGRLALGPTPWHKDMAGASELQPPRRFRNPSETSGVRSLSPGLRTSVEGDTHSISTVSQTSFQATHHLHLEETSDEEQDQDILEVWFPGCHADIGGGWPLHQGEVAALSHVPLVWMIREAQKAGLSFDEVKLRSLNCCHDDADRSGDSISASSGGKQHNKNFAHVPAISIHAPTSSDLQTSAKPSLLYSTNSPNFDVVPSSTGRSKDESIDGTLRQSHFYDALDFAATRGKIHDVLQFNNGAGATGVISWNMMEYMPFRRMDLRADGSWGAISWPLPKGETRDIPHNAVIHNSVIKRMRADPAYRPGNLIVGGGGRGVRKAPEHLGIGRWKVHRDEGDPIGECYLKE
ncbi:hypothetical protein EJ05DRAFT_446101 [Pseudovirgaria hyperparasitica]|uniref:T6SS Phospholipase effector Tle1-like catalytic domain-containing protein n=1 Tax=Pseudovirgaria hyperparasitica TaxID=470096 RepID=A0A6A6VRH9_9PEZI|nr:uncharacterized protein EJ05DRAFT_446101 [Pseudovirgaria hyperparasitica]KAF2752803.1 hypothetical protein EJ05DRAFT_446101 [Pseudovirgaria hyperparasitica]